MTGIIGICPHCGGSGKMELPADAREAIKLFYRLNDGLGCNTAEKYVTFKSQASAVIFKAAHPTWKVGWRRGSKNEKTE